MVLLARYRFENNYVRYDVQTARMLKFFSVLSSTLKRSTIILTI